MGPGFPSKTHEARVRKAKTCFEEINSVICKIELKQDEVPICGRVPWKSIDDELL